MSERILKALMELFAIVSRPEDINTAYTDRRPIVEAFLKRQLNQELVLDYLKIFDSFSERHQNLVNQRGKKRIGPDSVKILRICDQINKELTQRQKIIVLAHLFEFVGSSEAEISAQEDEFIDILSESFYINKEEHLLIRSFTLADEDEVPESNKILVINNKADSDYSPAKHLQSKHLRGQIRILHVESANIYFINYLGNSELYLNGQLLQPYKINIFNTGSSIRDHNIRPIYYSDVASLFHETDFDSKILFEVNNISYEFKNGKIGLFPMSFTEESGKLVGIMGASGAGKTTLLNVLNGSAKPDKGDIYINGVNIHTEKNKIEGLIGYVSQDDLLIEDLTVFQNLYFNAKLCFTNFKESEIIEAVNKMLTSLGLYEIKDIQVGTPLNKKISGGQRKRLNIALELMREPAVLFLDEPTSGLSSRDSENIMDLLKELSLKGKLVFVVIHQPSSDIFKMFDKLLILDTGGYLIYDGDPIDSILYFKKKIHHANYNESECHVCGNVNPEQIFNIVESNILDEYGKFTQNRKISPKEWYNYYIEDAKKKPEPERVSNDIPKISFKIPNRLKQLIVFIRRDFLSKLANHQYLVINMLESPVLAFILSFIIKYYNEGDNNELGYTFIGNSNLPVYIFMAVIVAIFMGLTVSSEEIIKDRKILKREAFLNLSWSSYLLSKVSILFLLSSIQSFLFVIVGNSIMEIKGMNLHYWIILFSCWVSSNIMGLIISDSFKTVVTIYILIPFLVIPQIILSGIIVKYDKLNPSISSPDRIPIYGEIIVARWGYEALAVHQFTENRYMKEFYTYNKLMSVAEYKKNYWVKNLQNKVDYIDKYLHNDEKADKISSYLNLLINEISKELTISTMIEFSEFEQLKKRHLNRQIIESTRNYLNLVNRYYIRGYNKVNDERDKIIRNKQKTEKDKNSFIELKRRYHNDKLAEFVENTNETVRIIEYKGRLIQKIDPIYLNPESSLIKAHFYAPVKQIFGKSHKTFWVNTIVVWLGSLMLFIILYFRGLKRLIDAAENFNNKYGKKS